MKVMVKSVMVVAIIATLGFGLVVSRGPYPMLRGDEVVYGCPIPYLGGSRSPGDQIGTTYYDWQTGGSFGQRIDVDDNFQAHIDWMKMDGGQTTRNCEWNARFADGTYFGETQASYSWSGYVQLDITRDANPDNQRTVITYHYNAGQGYYSWIDIDAGNLWGMWPNDPKTPAAVDHIWPYVAVANNGNIIMATGDYNASVLHLWLTTDEGDTWTLVLDTDSCATLSQFVRASQNPGSQKVVFIWTQYIEYDQFANDVYYMLSTDGGVTWGSPVNITHYIPPSQIVDTATWAYCNVNGVFDNNDNLHIAWGGYQAYVQAGTLYVLRRAKIFHWDEVLDTISVVNSPSIYYNQPEGWWLDEYGRAGGWRTAADQPQLIVDPNSDTLYCLWHGQDDTTDYSAGGWFNGELYGSYSSDNGLTWADYVNLTNTRTPGAGPGECEDEDYGTVCPRVVNDSIFITYIEDKDAGGWPQGEGGLTENPVRCWVVGKREFMYGVAEHRVEKLVSTGLTLYPNPVSGRLTISYGVACSGDVLMSLFDVMGRVVKSIVNGYRTAGTHKADFRVDGLASGTYFVVLQTAKTQVSKTVMVVH